MDADVPVDVDLDVDLDVDVDVDMDLKDELALLLIYYAVLYFDLINSNLYYVITFFLYFNLINSNLRFNNNKFFLKAKQIYS